MSSKDSVSVSLDAVEMEQMKRTLERRQRCTQALPKIAFVFYLLSATTLTFLCLTSPSFRPFITRVRSAAEAHQEAASWKAFSFGEMAIGTIEDKNIGEFEAQYTCGSGDQVCTDDNNNAWCCPNSDSCDSHFGECDTIDVAVVVGIIIAIWGGPLLIYLFVIAFVRCSNAERFRHLSESGTYESWIIVSGCFQMSIERSSGDADFNQVVFNMVNVYGGCGDECLMHAIGIFCCGFCYPCCMCCVSASRNQTKVTTLQASLAMNGYNTKVEFLSSIIPACCNSIFIGKLGRIAAAGNVMIISSGGMPVAGAPLLYQQQYAPYGSSQQQQPVQAHYAQAAPGYQLAAPMYQQGGQQGYGTVSAQPPEVNKP